MLRAIGTPSLRLGDREHVGLGPRVFIHRREAHLTSGIAQFRVLPSGNEPGTRIFNDFTQRETESYLLDRAHLGYNEGSEGSD